MEDYNAHPLATEAKAMVGYWRNTKGLRGQPLIDRLKDVRKNAKDMEDREEYRIADLAIKLTLINMYD